MIVVFGSVNLDLVARVPRLPGPGETLQGTSFTTLPGGKGANQALVARRSGATVAMVGAVGRDTFAAPALAGLLAAGVELDGIAAVDHPTGIALIHIDAAGENAITIVAGANAHASASSIRPTHWSCATTMLLQLETPMAEVIAVAQEARGRGIRVVLNAAPMQTLPPALLAVIDVLVVNEHEAAALAIQLKLNVIGDALADALSDLLQITVVQTLGANGACVAAPGLRWHARPPAIEVVDSTGAGDAFTGALAAALDCGAPWPLALTQGVAAGALACGRVGAQTALADHPAIAAFAERVKLAALSPPSS